MSENNRKQRIGILLVVIIPVFIAAIYVGNLVSNQAIEQPIAFNHKKHIDAGLECIDCHRYYKTQSNSGRPTLQICMDCHSGPSKNPEEQKIGNFAEQKTEIPWNRIYRMPDHVRFSHRLHTQIAKINCEKCHGNMAEQTKPPPRPLVSQTMQFCIDCHEETHANVDCLACHT